ncbi:hypothetical protein FRB99_006240 [Tulasnella sp. 403]|nr:hypothetical protein FRB99_006240 [Tulasnella sp. 403]
MGNNSWSYSLRNDAAGLEDESSDEENVPKTARTANQIDEFNFSNREDVATFKPNPWSIAKLNAATRKSQPTDMSYQPRWHTALQPKRKQGEIAGDDAPPKLASEDLPNPQPDSAPLNNSQLKNHNGHSAVLRSIDMPAAHTPTSLSRVPHSNTASTNSPSPTHPRPIPRKLQETNNNPSRFNPPIHSIHQTTKPSSRLVLGPPLRSIPDPKAAHAIQAYTPTITPDNGPRTDVSETDLVTSDPLLLTIHPQRQVLTPRLGHIEPADDSPIISSPHRREATRIIFRPSEHPLFTDADDPIWSTFPRKKPRMSKPKHSTESSGKFKLPLALGPDSLLSAPARPAYRPPKREDTQGTATPSTWKIYRVTTQTQYESPGSSSPIG